MNEVTKKRFAVISSVILLMWYSLSMLGLKIGGQYLVEGALKNEWMFLLIPTITLLIFAFSKRVGKYIHLAWLSLWLVTQFLSHEWYTIFGSGFLGEATRKIEYFENCVKLISIEGRYVPDLYHIILHILIVVAIIVVSMVPGSVLQARAEI